jgi:hypothetical protein
MSERRGSQIIWAAVLIIGGVLLLVFNYGLLQAYEPLAQWIAAGAMALAGVGFLLSVTRTPAAWWRLIPAWTLLALAVMVLLSTVEQAGGPLVAAVLFWGLGLAFGHIYLRARNDNWWALVPGSILLLFGFFVLSGGGRAGAISLRWWPLLAIAAGLLIGWRALRAPPAPKMEVNRAPALRSESVASAAQPATAGASIQVLSDPNE